MYNLSIQGDTINKRSKVIDSIILAKPHMIIYGISEGDFADSQDSKFDNRNHIFPNIQDIISKEINPEQYYEFLKIPPSPKDKTWNVIRQINKDDSSYLRFTPFPNSPFLKILKASTITVSELELKNLAANMNPFGTIKKPENNESLKNLKYIINEVQKENIKILFFIVPHHNYLTSAETKEYKESFDMIINEINSTGVMTYPRSTTYDEIDIWHDLSHIAVNNESLVFSKDISKIILKELDF